MTATDAAKKKKGSKLKWIALIIIVIVVAFSGGILFYLNGLGAADPSNTDEITVEIPSGSGASYIVDLLDEKGLVKNRTAAKVKAKIGGYDSLQANTYILNKSMTFPEIMDVINTGNFDYLMKESIKVSDGARLEQVADEISEQLGYSSKEIMKKWNDKAYVKELIGKYWFLTDEILSDKVMYPLEGYLYADTYYLTSDDVTIESFTEMCLDQMDEALTERKAQIEATGFSVHEFLTLTSIVTKEATANDQAGVAGVFMNRLKEGMSLGSDVTVCYIFQEDRVDLKVSQLSSDSPYNTRKVAGLPPGPICQVISDAMDAVINYENNDYLFFFAGPDGTVYYAKTEAEHEKNISEHPWSEEDLAQ